MDKKLISFFSVMITLISLFFLSPGAILAHPPSGLTLSYDPVTQILDVLAKHNVKDPDSHFIAEFKVFVDDKQIYELGTSVQFSESTAKALFYLPDLKPGAEITVEAECSKFGSSKQSIKVK